MTVTGVDVKFNIALPGDEFLDIGYLQERIREGIEETVHYLGGLAEVEVVEVDELVTVTVPEERITITAVPNTIGEVGELELDDPADACFCGSCQGTPRAL